MQTCKGIGFTDSDLNCRGWIEGRSLSLRLQPCWGAILTHFQDSFLSKEICYNLNSELERQYLIQIIGSQRLKGPFVLGSNASIPPGSLFQQRLSLGQVLAKVIAELDHVDDQESKGKRNVEQKGHWKNKRKKGGKQQ